MIKTVQISTFTWFTTNSSQTTYHTDDNFLQQINAGTLPTVWNQFKSVSFNQFYMYFILFKNVSLKVLIDKNLKI